MLISLGRVVQVDIEGVEERRKRHASLPRKPVVLKRAGTIDFLC